ncbi:hypothetical protein H1R20_g16498, partial [Candolleomyces eurysporus]
MEQRASEREYYAMAILGFQPPASSTALNADSTSSTTTFENTPPSLGCFRAADVDSPRPRPKARRRAQDVTPEESSMHQDALIGSATASGTTTTVTTASSSSSSSIHQSSGVRSLSQDSISRTANQLEIPPSLQLNSQVQTSPDLIPQPEDHLTASSAASNSALTNVQPDMSTHPHRLGPDYLGIPEYLPMILNYPNPHINDATFQTSFDFDPVFLGGQNQAPSGFDVAYANGQDGDGTLYELNSLFPFIGDFPDGTLPSPDLSADPNGTQYGELSDFNPQAYQNGAAQAYLNMLMAFDTQNTVLEDITEPECVNTAELWPEHCDHHANNTFYLPQPGPVASTSQLPAQPTLSQPSIQPSLHLCPFCLSKSFESEYQLKRHVKHAYAGVKKGTKTRCTPPDNWETIL